jgi:HAD superfamily hydrolase (TIGR01490 family)
VFDLDGTLIRWQLFHVIVDRLGKANKLNAEHYRQVRESRMAWKRREDKHSFETYQNKLIEAYESALKDLSETDIQTITLQAFEEHKDQSYVYTKNLMNDLKGQGYVLFAISGSFNEVVALIAEHYGFDASAGTQQSKINGKFTGAIDVIQNKRKVDILKQLKQNFNLTDNRSIAVGDSMGDYDILCYVEKPIAFNPTQELFAKAQEHGWQIVVERKNVIYTLTKNDGSYVLS